MERKGGFMKKYKIGSAAWKRRRETINDQWLSTTRFHPRGLARAVARSMNEKANKSPSDMGSWKDDVSKLPKYGKKYLRRTDKNRIPVRK